MAIIKNGVGITTLLNGETVKQTLDPANETVEKGVYDETILSAVDGDLAPGNIKSGVNIFGKDGSTNVRDSTDADLAVGEARTGKTFYAGGGARKTGSGTQTLNPANETVNAGYYEATTLSAVDADLAPGNIKDGVTIFGFAGTVVAGTLAEDIEGDDYNTTATGAAGAFYQWQRISTTTFTLATKTQTYDASSLAFATAFFNGRLGAGGGTSGKLSLNMDGVEMQTFAFSNVSVQEGNVVLRDFKVLSGSKICNLEVSKTSGGSSYDISTFSFLNVGELAAAISIGSVKLA